MRIFNRNLGKEEEEKICGENVLLWLYERRALSSFALFFIRLSFFSKLYGFFQRRKKSVGKIRKFADEFGIDPSEFEKEITEFSSFNDFFIRKLKRDKRPIAEGEDIAILPADARYLVFSKIEDFFLKGQNFSLSNLLQDVGLFKRYRLGSMAIARLAPSDCHRFYFPFGCFAGEPSLINGYLYSVNPIALKKNINFLSENKRFLTLLKSQIFGDVLYIEIGATNVGSITQTFVPENFYKKGAEKGYFSLGGSTIVLLFEKGKIKFEQDLLEMSSKKIETKACFGQIMGRA